MQTPLKNTAVSWERRIGQLNSLDDFLFVSYIEAQIHKNQLTLRTGLIWALPSLFFDVSGLAHRIRIFWRFLCRSWWFNQFCGHIEDIAAPGSLSSHYTTAGSKPSFHQDVLQQQQQQQQYLQHLVCQSGDFFKTPHRWYHWYLRCLCIITIWLLMELFTVLQYVVLHGSHDQLSDFLHIWLHHMDQLEAHPGFYYPLNWLKWFLTQSEISRDFNLPYLEQNQNCSYQSRITQWVN